MAWSLLFVCLLSFHLFPLCLLHGRVSVLFCAFAGCVVKFAGWSAGTMASAETPPVSIRHGARLAPDPGIPIEEVLLAVGDTVGHDNMCFASRMNKAIVVFMKEERYVNQLVESGAVIRDLYVEASPLATPSIKITISGVPPFIPNGLLEQELRRFGKFASGFKTVGLGCKDPKLKHMQSLRRQVFMFLDSPTQTLEVSFRVKHEEGHYMVYASSGSIKCFECGDIGHKRGSCPHKNRAEHGATAAAAAVNGREGDDARGVPLQPEERAAPGLAGGGSAAPSTVLNTTRSDDDAEQSATRAVNGETASTALPAIRATSSGAQSHSNTRAGPTNSSTPTLFTVALPDNISTDPTTRDGPTTSKTANTVALPVNSVTSASEVCTPATRAVPTHTNGEMTIFSVNNVTDCSVAAESNDNVVSVGEASQAIGATGGMVVDPGSSDGGSGSVSANSGANNREASLTTEVTGMEFQSSGPFSGSQLTNTDDEEGEEIEEEFSQSSESGKNTDVYS